MEVLFLSVITTTILLTMLSVSWPSSSDNVGGNTWYNEGRFTLFNPKKLN